MMTQLAIKKIEEKIRRDGSLTEEKKVELLNLLATMNPGIEKSSNVLSEYAKRITELSKFPILAGKRGGKKTL